MSHERRRPATGKPAAPEAALTWDQVARWRLKRHLLGAEQGTGAVGVARRCCGVHAQVASSAVTATRLRAPAVGAGGVERALGTERTLVKTWAARGTLHLLATEDLPVWVSAMSTRTREAKGSWLRYHGVTEGEMSVLMAAIPEALGQDALTREELTERVVALTGDDHIREAVGQSWGALLKPPAFRGHLCFGPNRGRNVTFVSPAAWLGRAPEPVPSEVALDRIARDHLGAYGPTDPAELARWFDMALRLAKAAYGRLESELAPVDVEGTALFALRQHVAGLEEAPDEPVVRLLPGFDPYVVGSLSQLEHIAPAGRKREISRAAGWISATVCVDGRLVGTWEGQAGPAGLGVVVHPFENFDGAVTRALAGAGRRTAAAMGLDDATVEAVPEVGL